MTPEVESKIRLADPTYDGDAVLHYTSDLVWKLGRSCLLSWLRRRRQVEPWFVQTPIQNKEFLSIAIVAALEAPATDDGIKGHFWDVLTMARLLKRKRTIEDADVLFSLGMQCIDASALQLRRNAQRYSRHLHLRSFCLRIGGDLAGYRRQMSHFNSVANGPLGVSRDYEQVSHRGRHLYEQGCCLRYGFGLHGIRSSDSRVRTEEALALFREAEKVAVNAIGSNAIHPMAHVLFGSMRGIFLSLLDLDDSIGARVAWREFCGRFPGMGNTHLAYDAELLRSVACFGAKTGAIGELVNFTINALRLQEGGPGSLKQKLEGKRTLTFLENVVALGSLDEGAQELQTPENSEYPVLAYPALRVGPWSIKNAL